MTPAAGSPSSMTGTGARPKEPIRCRFPCCSRRRARSLCSAGCPLGTPARQRTRARTVGRRFQVPRATCLPLFPMSARTARVPFSSSRPTGWRPCEAVPKIRSNGLTRRRPPNACRSYARITLLGGCRAIPDNSTLRAPNPKTPCFCKKARGNSLCRTAARRWQHQGHLLLRQGWAPWPKNLRDFPFDKTQDRSLFCEGPCETLRLRRHSARDSGFRRSLNITVTTEGVETNRAARLASRRGLLPGARSLIQQRQAYGRGRGALASFRRENLESCVSFGPAAPRLL
ncbi:hypothetical protein ACVWWO_003613 [Bradyrhizobium sp. F1.13.1]